VVTEARMIMVLLLLERNRDWDESSTKPMMRAQQSLEREFNEVELY